MMEPSKPSKPPAPAKTAEMRFAWADGTLVDAHELCRSAAAPPPLLCTTCPERHEVRLCRANHARYSVPAWFRHNAPPHGTGGGGPGGGGESETHLHAKFLLQKHAGRYYVDAVACQSCRNVVRVLSEGATVALEHPVGRYRCDAVLKSGRVQDCRVGPDGLTILESSPDVALEVFHTHATEEPKIAALADHGVLFVELSAGHVIERLGELTPESGLVQLQAVKPRRLCEACVLTHLVPLERLVSEWKEIRTQAVALANRQEEASHGPRPKPRFEKGRMFLCSECDHWERKEGRAVFFRNDPAISNDWFDDFDDITRVYKPCTETLPDGTSRRVVKSRYAVLLCYHCKTDCNACWAPMPLSCAAQYGLCYRCNREGKAMEEKMRALRHELAGLPPAGDPCRT